MKILYLSCHSILEYDEVTMFHEMGHQIFSPGAYVEPANPGDASLRPGILDLAYTDEDVAAWHAIPCPEGVDRKSRLTREFVERFDVVIVMHMPNWILDQWDVLSCRPVVWRTIGQSLNGTEMAMAAPRGAGMKVVRYSPRERTIPHFIGEDAMIRFAKNPDDFQGYNGDKPCVVTFNQHMEQRSQACNYATWDAATKPFNRKLYGPGNDRRDRGHMGKVPFSELQAALRDNRCYFYTGTHPASYTLNFMEAWLTGIPIVAIGPKLGNAHYFPGHDLYEVPDLIEHGRNGFVTDDVDEMRGCIRALMDDHQLATRIGHEGRLSAIACFDTKPIAAQWRQFLETL